MTIIDKIGRYGFASMLWLMAHLIAVSAIYSDDRHNFFSTLVYVLAAGFSYYSAWKPQNTLEELLRYVFLGGMWLSIANLSNFAFGSSVPSTIIVVGIIGAAVTTYGWLLRERLSFLSRPHSDQNDSTAHKRKNEQADFHPLELLTPDDFEELRAEMKDRLRQRILSETDGESTSLNDLLNQPPTRAKHP